MSHEISFRTWICVVSVGADRSRLGNLPDLLFIIDILAAPMLNKLSSSPDVLSNASGGQLNVGIGSSIGAEAPSTVFDTISRSITLIK